jgi:hypothetical protein
LGISCGLFFYKSLFIRDTKAAIKFLELTKCSDEEIKRLSPTGYKSSYDSISFRRDIQRVPMKVKTNQCGL